MKNPFKRKTKKVKLSKGHTFLEGLRKAVYLNKSKDDYEERFHSILARAEDKTIVRNAIKKHFDLLENIEKAEKARKHKINNPVNMDTLREAILESREKPNFNFDKLHYVDDAKTTFVIPQNKRPSKVKTFFTNLGRGIKDTWLLARELVREIQYWFIAEYKIITKLSYALNRKRNEIKVRKAFDSNKKFFTDKFGYDKGMNYFYMFSTKINRGAELNKRMLDKGM